MKKLTTIFAILFAISAHAQVLWTIPNVTFEQGDTVEARFHVSGFVSIASFSYTMRCDTAFIDFLLLEQSPEFQDEQTGQGGLFTQQQIDSLLGKDPAYSDDGAKSSLATPLEFTGAMPNFGINNFSWHGRPGYNLLPGEIRALRSQATGTTVADGLHIYTVKFRAKQSGNLSDKFWLWYNHPVLKPRAYSTPPLTSVGLDIVYTDPAESTVSTGGKEAAGISVAVSPNPARADGTANVFVSLPEAGEVQINILDSAGYNVFGGFYRHGGGVESYEVGGLPVGAHFLRVTVGNKTITKIIVRQ